MAEAYSKMAESCAGSIGDTRARAGLVQSVGQPSVVGTCEWARVHIGPIEDMRVHADMRGLDWLARLADLGDGLMGPSPRPAN
jgi:hypothetical protein